MTPGRISGRSSDISLRMNHHAGSSTRSNYVSSSIHLSSSQVSNISSGCVTTTRTPSISEQSTRRPGSCIRTSRLPSPLPNSRLQGESRRYTPSASSSISLSHSKRSNNELSSDEAAPSHNDETSKAPEGKIRQTHYGPVLLFILQLLVHLIQEKQSRQVEEELRTAAEKNEQVSNKYAELEARIKTLEDESAEMQVGLRKCPAIQQEKTSAKMTGTIRECSSMRVGKKNTSSPEPYETLMQETLDRLEEVKNETQEAWDVGKGIENEMKVLQDEKKVLESLTEELAEKVKAGKVIENKMEVLQNENKVLESRTKELAEELKAYRLQGTKTKAMQRDMATQTDQDEKGSEPEVELEDGLQEKPVEEEQEIEEEGNSDIMMLEKAVARDEEQLERNLGTNNQTGVDITGQHGLVEAPPEDGQPMIEVSEPQVPAEQMNATLIGSVHETSTAELSERTASAVAQTQGRNDHGKDEAHRHKHREVRRHHRPKHGKHHHRRDGTKESERSRVKDRRIGKLKTTSTRPAMWIRCLVHPTTLLETYFGRGRSSFGRRCWVGSQGRIC